MSEDRPQVAPGESLDLLCGDWRIFQLERGHRFSTDDFLTAWLAARARPGATSLLDIGAGIGSVGLITLFHMRDPAAQLTMVEVQELSHRLARKTIDWNGLSTRVRPRHGDLRDPALVPEGERYELVTGSPPYIPIGKGVISPHPQRAGARIELKGDVFDYCRTAARALAPGGAFCFCHAALDPRPEAAVKAAGLGLVRRVDVYFRRNREPTIALFECTSCPEGHSSLEEVVVREADGSWSEQYLHIRQQMGLPNPGQVPNRRIFCGG